MGSIPACAGEPIQVAATSTNPAVYPRVCGGARSSDVDTENAEGLSPRVRGSQAQHAVTRAHDGSIPACAREPVADCCGGHFVPVYPRVCGGASDTASHMTAPDGLSPRVRGSPTYAAPPGDETRSIPACAGEPA